MTLPPIESGSHIPTREALSEWLSKDMVNNGITAELIPQAAPNRHINVYRVKHEKEDLFVKVYLDTPDVAEKELSNYQYFEGLTFIPPLRYSIFPQTSEKRLIAYDFVEGDDLHRQFTAARAQGKYLSKAIIPEAILQFQVMEQTVKPHDDQLPVKTPWPLKSPIRRDFLTKEAEVAFMHDYEFITEENQKTLRAFPGYYFDRNPRNLMHDNGSVQQVDFGVIERSSPIFDLVKLIRNGTDIATPLQADQLREVVSNSPMIENIATYPNTEEDYFLKEAYQAYVDGNPRNGKSFDEFRHHFDYASIHSHIFYVTKYLAMFKSGKGDTNKLVTRSAFHLGMIKRTLEVLKPENAQIAKLEPWIDQFAEIALS